MASIDNDKTQYYQHLIRHAIRAIGFSREERDLKIDRVRWLDLQAEALRSCINNTHEVIYTGSFADGCDFKTSDLDVIRRMPGFKILSDFTLPRFGPQISPKNSGYFAICGIEYEEEFPCYVKLPILKKRSLNKINTTCITIIKRSENYYLQNTFIKKEMVNSKKLSDTSASAIHRLKFVDNFEYSSNGPAIREEFHDSDTHSKSERDLVLTLFFDEWPCIATEFLHRKRSNKWFSKQTLQSMQTKGCDLAAVGHADSQEKDLQWRISFCGERDLFKSLNEIQIHCFLLMKIMLKDDMPLNKEKDIISSFHLKNVIYWCIERSPKPWSRENFLFAFKRCLFRLMDFLFNRYLPYYIVPRRNLFNSRLTEDIAEQLIQECKKYADNPMNILLLKSFDGLFKKTVSKMDLSERISNLNIAELKLQTQRSIIRQCFTRKIHLFTSIQRHEFWKYLTPWHDVNGGIDNWRKVYTIMFYGYKPYMKYELKNVECIGALMFYARYKQTNDVKDLRYSRSLIKESLDLRVSSNTIRAASFYYLEKEYARCDEICETFLKHPPPFLSDFWRAIDQAMSANKSFIDDETNIANLLQRKNELLPFYGIKNGSTPQTGSDLYTVMGVALLELFNDFPYVSFKQKYIYVVYVTAEKWVVPEVLLYELLSRSADSDNDYYRQFAGIFVDPQFNAWLLLHLCDLNRKDNSNDYIKLSDDTLGSMQKGIDKGLQPIYQYCNIYAYCLLKSNFKVKAVKYILKSLRNYPSKYNAAFSYLRAIVHVLKQIVELPTMEFGIVGNLCYYKLVY